MTGWDYLLVLVVSAILVRALAPKIKQQNNAAALQDFDAPVAEEGREIPVIFGTVTIKGQNVLWYGDLTVEPIRKEGGKK